jgi:hypothetical protein
MVTGNFQVRNNEIWNKDTNNIAPRLGFAFDVLGNRGPVAAHCGARQRLMPT